MNEQLTPEEQAWSVYGTTDGRCIKRGEMPEPFFYFKTGFRANLINKELNESLGKILDDFRDFYTMAHSGNIFHFDDLPQVIQARAVLDKAKQFKSE